MFVQLLTHWLFFDSFVLRPILRYDDVVQLNSLTDIGSASLVANGTESTVLANLSVSSCVPTQDQSTIFDCTFSPLTAGGVSINTNGTYLVVIQLLGASDSWYYLNLPDPNGVSTSFVTLATYTYTYSSGTIPLPLNPAANPVSEAGKGFIISLTGCPLANQSPAPTPVVPGLVPVNTSVAQQLAMKFSPTNPNVTMINGAAPIA